MILGFAFYQIVIFTLTTLLLLNSFIKLFRKKKTFREFIISCVFWVNASLFALYPSIIDKTAKFIGFQEGVNAVFAFLLFIFIYITINLSSQNERTEKSITKLVRELALKELKRTKT